MKAPVGVVLHWVSLQVSSMRLIEELTVCQQNIIAVGFATAVSYFRLHFLRQNLESADAEGWQSFDVSQYLNADQYVTVISLVMRGTGSGASGFYLLDARFIGVAEKNPTNQFYVRSL